MSPIDVGGIAGDVISAPVISSIVPGENKVTVIFSSVAGALGYDLYSATVAGVKKFNSTKIVGAISPQDVTGLTNGIPVFVVVVAFDAETESNESNELSETPVGGVVRVRSSLDGGISRGLTGF